MFNIEISELLIIFLVALIVLGPEKLPELGRFWGKFSLEVQKNLKVIKKELQLEEFEKELRELKEILKSEVDGNNRTS